MGVEIKRLTRGGVFLDFERILDEVVNETKVEIDEAIDQNLSGGMINKTSTERWYVGEVVGHPRSRRLEYTVDPDGLEVPKILHAGVSYSWRIRAVNVEFLRWEDEQGVHYARRVTHPAMPPRPFVEEPVRRIARKIPDRVRRRIRQQFQKG